MHQAFLAVSLRISIFLGAEYKYSLTKELNSGGLVYIGIGTNVDMILLQALDG